MHLKQLLFIVLLLGGIFLVKAQTAPGIQWQRNIGTNFRDGIYSVQQTNDGGYVTAGYDSSFLTIEGYIARVVKLNFDGTTQWQKTIRIDSFYTSAQSIQQTNDNGYIIAGTAGVVQPGGQSFLNALIVKLNSNGDTVWSRVMGGNSQETGSSAIQTADGGYILVGSAKSNDGDVIGNHSDNYDMWVIKFDNMGVVEWKKCYGGSEWDDGRFIRQTNEGGYIICGYTRSVDGDVMGYHGGSSDVYDAWILKLDATGTIEWQKCLGGTGWDDAASIQQTNDGGYVLGASTESINGDVTGNHGSFDMWVVKLSAAGAIQWQKSFGGTSYDGCHSIKQTSDGGFIVAGLAVSADGDVNGLHGFSSDCWILKLDSNGNLLWQKCIGGTQGEDALDVCPTSDGGYFIGGITWSSDGDLTVGYVPEDSWVIKLGPLPVPLKLKGFTAQKQNKSILLNWQTQTEINTKHFVVEKSNNGIDFKILNTIETSGNSPTTKNYSCIDALPFHGMNYYRLQQVDKDGSFVYSETVAVNFNGKSSIVYPNPASSVITIVPSGILKNILIIDASGKKIQQLTPSANNQYNISSLHQGLYLVQLYYDNANEVMQFSKK